MACRENCGYVLRVRNQEPNIALPLDVSHLPRGEKILVACSGGADSTALLLWLCNREYSCLGAHVNHNTRGEASDGDENFVRELCAKLEVPFVTTKLNLPPGANEAVMRDARYAALLAWCREYSCAFIATGHTANDNLETILMNWLRGASVSGLAGIPPARALAAGVLLARPLLGATRAQIRDFLVARNQSWREDSSNQSARYLRNRVRNELLPMVEELGFEENRLALQTLRASQIRRDDLEFLESAATEALQHCVLHDEENLLILNGERFRNLPIALQRRVLRLGAQKMENSAREINATRVEEVRLHVTQNKRRAVWQWTKTLRTEWTGDQSGNRIRFRRV
jgi:tRNA(Ile)-lysidine synthase